MYDLPYYKAHNHADVLAFMKAHPFIVLCGVDANNRPVATQVPVMFSENEAGQLVLKAHVQRKTDHHIAFSQNANVLAIFTGDHSYVSASWYANPNVGSTWNYQSVQATGILKFGSKPELHQLLTELTDHFENNPHSPSLVKDMPPHYVEHLMKAIDVFEITVTEIRHVFKLSQNRDDVSRENIIAHLAAKDDYPSKQVAENMKAYYAAQVPEAGGPGNEPQ